MTSTFMFGSELKTEKVWQQDICEMCYTQARTTIDSRFRPKLYDGLDEYSHDDFDQSRLKTSSVRSLILTLSVQDALPV